MLCIPDGVCPRKLKRKLYHLGLPLFPKVMRKDRINNLISKTLNISDEQAGEVFQQLRSGLVYKKPFEYLFSSGFVGDVNVIFLREIALSNGEKTYKPSTYNPLVEDMNRYW